MEPVDAPAPASPDPARASSSGAGRPLWKKVLFGCLPLLLVIPIVEGMFRMAGLGRPDPPLPNSAGFTTRLLTAPDGRESKYSEGLYVGKSIVLNAEGYRDWLYFEDEREGALRIAGLGDSYTFGDGLEPDETWLRQLETRVAAGLADRSVRSLNFGRRGSNTHEQRGILEEDVLRFAPDLLVHGFTLFNDAETKEYRESTTKKHRARAKETSWNLAQWLNANSYTVHFVIKLLRRGRNQRAMRDHIATQYAADAPGFIECRNALREIAQTCREREIPLVFVLFPSHHKDPILNDFTTTEFAEAHAKVTAALADFPEVVIVDMADHLADFQGQVIWIPGNGHPDARYCERVAEVLAPEVIRLLGK